MGCGTPIYKEVKLCNGSNSLLLLLPPAALALYETRPADRELPPAGTKTRPLVLLHNPLMTLLSPSDAIYSEMYCIEIKR
jgi:hypothetical protein